MANYTVNAYNNNGTGGSVNMRAGATSSAPIVKQVPHGATVSGTKTATWSHMSYIEPGYQTYTGYMMSAYLDAQGSGGIGPGTGSSKSGVVTLSSGTLNVRSGPSTGHGIIGSLQNGEVVIYLDAPIWGSGMTWYQLISPHYGGYVATQYIQATGGSAGGGTYLGQGTVMGGRLYCRKQPVSGHTAWGQFANGVSIPIFTCATSGWYETRWPATGSDVGYVMAQYVSMGGGSGTGGGTTIHGVTILDIGAADMQKILDMLQSETNHGYPGFKCDKAVREAYPQYPLSNGSDMMYYDNIQASNRGLISNLPGGLQPGYLIFQQCTGPATCSKGCPSTGPSIGIKPGTNDPHMSHVGVVVRVDWDDGTGPQLAVFQSVSDKSSPLRTTSSLKAMFLDDDLGGPNITSLGDRWKYYGIL